MMRAACVAIGILGVLAGCGAPQTPALVQSCVGEVNAAGSYEFVPGGEAPSVTPGSDGTAEGAAAINFCIDQRLGRVPHSHGPDGTHSHGPDGTHSHASRASTAAPPPVPAQ
ncbi:MAG: hypothetical protein AAFV62_11970 [Pseudomonadota bacterium]